MAEHTSAMTDLSLFLELGGRPKRGANEEATQPRSGRPNPTDPGDAADLSIPQGYLCLWKKPSFGRAVPKPRNPYPDCLHVCPLWRQSHHKTANKGTKSTYFVGLIR
jgi:hypothetical protein